jgi:hypothetical protein
LAGRIFQGSSSVAIGASAGRSAQGSNAVAVGGSAGLSSQSNNAVAIGFQAGETSQAFSSVAIGNAAGKNTQGQNAVAIGTVAGATNQGTNAIAIGNGGQIAQGSGAIAIGQGATNGQGQFAIAIGLDAAVFTQTAGSIVLNGSETIVNAPAVGFYVNPVRSSAVGASAQVLSLGPGNEICVNSAKTFVIPYPLHPKTHYLQHACLEGPEAGIYYRGEAEIPVGETEVTVNLPDYVSKLGKNFTVQITPKDKFCFLSASTVQSNGSFRVMNRNFSFLSKMVNLCHHNNKRKHRRHNKTSGKKSCIFFWIVMGERLPIEPELCQTDVRVHGHGPYLWVKS